MNEGTTLSTALVVAAVVAVVLVVWILYVLFRDRHHDKENILRSDAAVDSALEPTLEAYQQAVQNPDDEALEKVDNRLKDLLMVVVSFTDVDDDFKSLPAALEAGIANIDKLKGMAQEDRAEVLKTDLAALKGYHQKFESLLTSSS